MSGSEGEREFETGEQGLFGGAKKETRRGWWISLNGQELSVSQTLAKLGAEGWELVSAVVSQDCSSGGLPPHWYKPDHWLYFKRPKGR